MSELSDWLKSDPTGCAEAMERVRDALRAEGAAAERERIRPELEILYAEIQRLAATVPTESETRAAFEAERAKARAAERERLRLELLAEAEHQGMLAAAWVLRDFAHRLEATK